MALPGNDLREAVIGLTSAAQTDLAALWQEVADAADAGQALNDILPGLVDHYGTMAAALAADWYDELRDKVGVPRAFTAIPADIPDPGVLALVGWALNSAKDPTTLRTLIEGGVQRRIANFSRLTVMGSAVADPSAHGWQRIGAGRCRSGFCDMLIARGAVYSEATADFAAHDHCQCSAIPAWSGRPIPVRPFTPSTRNISDADRARVHDWLATH